VLVTFGISGVGRSEAGSVARCRTTLLFLSTLKLARNLAFASWISCSLCSSNWSCSSTGKVSHIGSIILLGEMSELSLEPAIEGRFDESICAFPSGVAKSVLVPFWGANHCVRTGDGALCTGADGPRPQAGRSATWDRARGFLFDGRTVCAYRSDGPRVRRGSRSHRRRLDLTPGRDRVGEERS
jgi:hypothetical protein